EETESLEVFGQNLHSDLHADLSGRNIARMLDHFADRFMTVRAGAPVRRAADRSITDRHVAVAHEWRLGRDDPFVQSGGGCDQFHCGAWLEQTQGIVTQRLLARLQLVALYGIEV